MADNAENAQEQAQPKGKAKKEVYGLADVYSDYKDKAAETPSGEVLVNLLDSIDVEFKSDFRNIKKGHKMYGISRVAYDLYNKNGVVKVLAERKGLTDAELDKEEN